MALALALTAADPPARVGPMLSDALAPLWSEDPAQMARLVALSAEPGQREIVAAYIRDRATPVYEASGIANGHAPIKGFVEQAWRTMRAMPDPSLREAGRVLLLDAVGGLIYERNKDVLYLIAWLDDDKTRAEARAQR